MNFIAASIIGGLLWFYSILLTDTPTTRILLFLPLISLHIWVALLSFLSQRAHIGVWWLALAPIAGVINSILGSLLQLELDRIVVNDPPTEFIAQIAYSFKLVVIMWKQTLICCISALFWGLIFALLYFFWIKKWPEYLVDSK
jgi:hypothetical protein